MKSNLCVTNLRWAKKQESDYIFTFPALLKICKSWSPCRKNDMIYGSIAKKSTKFMGLIKNFALCGEQQNLTTYSNEK